MAPLAKRRERCLALLACSGQRIDAAPAAAMLGRHPCRPSPARAAMLSATEGHPKSKTKTKAKHSNSNRNITDTSKLVIPARDWRESSDRDVHHPLDSRLRGNDGGELASPDGTK